MPRRKIKTVPVGNGSVLQDKSGIGGITMEEVRRIMSEVLDKSFDELDKHLDRMLELTDKLLRAIYQYLAALEHDARQPSLAMGAEVEPDTKTRKRTEDAVTD